MSQDDKLHQWFFGTIPHTHIRPVLLSPTHSRLTHLLMVSVPLLTIAGQPRCCKRSLSEASAG